jgi:hypothetical protein
MAALKCSSVAVLTASPLPLPAGFPSFPALPPLPAPAVTEAPRRASAVDARAVELVASQADVEHAVALAALQRHNGDVMRAVMDLTTMM